MKNSKWKSQEKFQGESHKKIQGEVTGKIPRGKSQEIPGRSHRKNSKTDSQEKIQRAESAAITHLQTLDLARQ
jgi:hypothetical protein